MRKVVFACGLFAFLGTPVVALVLNVVAPNYVGDGVIVSTAIGAICAGFAAWPRPTEASGFGSHLGRLYVALAIGAMILGMLGGIFSPWLYEHLSK